MAHERQTISVTDEQLFLIAQKIVEQNVSEKVSDDVISGFVPSLNEYIQKHQIDVAPFTSAEHANSEQATEFLICFLGNVSYNKEDGFAFYDDPITTALKTYNEKYKVKDKKESEKLLKRNRDLKNLIEADEKISPHYWLTDSDIDAVLSHVFANDFVSRQKLAKATPLDKVRIIRELEGMDDRTVCLPVNKGGNHWIRLRCNEEKGPIFYADPLRKTKDEQLEKVLKGIFPDREIKCDSDGSQHDGWSCGYRAIQKILVDLGVTDHPIVKAKTSEEIRDAVFGVMRQITGKQLQLATSGASLTPAKISGDSKWTPVLEKQLHDAYPDIFKNVKNAKLKDHTVETTDLTDKNLEEFVKSTKALMVKLGFDGEVEVNAPADKKQKLIELCKLHKIKLAGDAKPESAPAKVEPERMDKTEETVSRSRGFATSPA